MCSAPDLQSVFCHYTCRPRSRVNGLQVDQSLQVAEKCQHWTARKAIFCACNSDRLRTSYTPGRVVGLGSWMRLYPTSLLVFWLARLPTERGFSDGEGTTFYAKCGPPVIIRHRASSALVLQCRNHMCPVTLTDAEALQLDWVQTRQHWDRAPLAWAKLTPAWTPGQASTPHPFSPPATPSDLQYHPKSPSPPHASNLSAAACCMLGIKVNSEDLSSFCSGPCFIP